MASRLLRFGTAFIEAVLALLFLIGYGARYAGPGRFWWAELIAVGLPYVSLCLLLFVPIHVFGRRWRRLVGYAIVVALIAIRFMPWPLARGAPIPEEDVLRVMTFNVSPWWDYYDDEERAGGMLALVQRVNPHLLLLQEAGVEYHEAHPRLRSAPHISILWEEGGFETVAPGKQLPAYTPQPALATVPISASSQELMRMEPDDVARSFVTRTRFSWEGRPIVAYNLHLRSFGEDKPWRSRSRSLLSPRFWIPYVRQFRSAFEVRAREAEILARMIEKETLPVLVIGDLNSTAHNWAYRRLSRGLQDAFRIAGRGWGATYHTKLPFVRIDFVLAGPEFEIVSAEVLGSRLSDHRPLVATLRWKQ